MKNKILILMFLTIFLIGIISAEESGGVLTGKQYDCINLPQECASCSYVNLTTITNPDLSQIPIHISMAKNGASFNSTFCSTVQIGSYSYCMVGDVDGIPTSACKNFYIGEVNTTLLLILGIFAIVLLTLSFIFENNLFAFISGLLFLVTGVYSIIYGFGNTTNSYTQMISWIIIGLGAIITIVSSLEFLKEMSEGNEDSGGFNDEDE